MTLIKRLSLFITLSMSLFSVSSFAQDFSDEAIASRIAPISDVYINGGFFVIHKNAIKKIKNSKIFWEREPLTHFIKIKKLFAFKHDGFWKSLDTQKDKDDFNQLYKKKMKKLPWKV